MKRHSFYYFTFHHRKKRPQNAGLGRCSFCSMDSEYAEAIHPGPGELRICSHCLKIARRIIDSPHISGSGKGHRCSFCSKSESEIGRLVPGPDVYICDQCVRRFSGA